VTAYFKEKKDYNKLLKKFYAKYPDLMPKWKNNKAALVYQDPTDLDNDNI
jgi:hypothetical protein